MPRTLSQAALAAARDESTAEVHLVFLEVIHPALDQPLRYVSGLEHAVNVSGVDWQPAPFQVAMPPDGLARSASVTLRFPAVNDSIMTALLSETRPPSIRIHTALASSPATIEMGPYPMLVARVEDTIVETVVELSYRDILNQPIVPARYTPGLTPALHK